MNFTTDATQFAADLTAQNIDTGIWNTIPAWTDVVDGYELAIAFEQPQDEDHIVSLMKYVLCGPFAMFGEFDGEIVHRNDEGTLLVFSVDTTKSRRDDVAWAFEDDCIPMLVEGTPVRKTDRAGAGTKGTRAVEGIVGGFVVAWR